MEIPEAIELESLTYRLKAVVRNSGSHFSVGAKTLNGWELYDDLNNSVNFCLTFEILRRNHVGGWFFFCYSLEENFASDSTNTLIDAKNYQSQSYSGNQSCNFKEHSLLNDHDYSQMEGFLNTKDRMFKPCHVSEQSGFSNEHPLFNDHCYSQTAVNEHILPDTNVTDEKFNVEKGKIN